MLSVISVGTNNVFGKRNEFDDMFEITKILSMFMKSSHIITEREKFLQNKVDNDAYGVFTLSKFEERSRTNYEKRSRDKQKNRICVF